jgi:hypothetical protein
MVVVDEFGIPLVRLAAEEAVEAFEAAAERPLTLRRREVHLVLRGQMPLADRIRVPASRVQDLRQVGALEGMCPFAFGKPDAASVMQAIPFVV